MSEVTGVSSLAIGRMLADIRKGDWERKFGQRQAAIEAEVARHKVRLDHHEKQLRQRPTKPTPTQGYVWGSGEEGQKARIEEPSVDLARIPDDWIYDAVKREERRRSKSELVMVAVLLFIGVLMFILIDSGKRRSEPVRERPRLELVP